MFVDTIPASDSLTLISVNVPETGNASNLLVALNPTIDGSSVPELLPNDSALNKAIEVVVGAKAIGVYTPDFPIGNDT